MKRMILFALCLLLVGIPIWGQDDGITLTVVTHDSFNVSEAILLDFEEETGITVQILRSGDAGQMVNQSILSKENPLGDVLFGVDNTFLSRALEADLFVPYESPLLENVPESFILDEEYRALPVDYGDVCLNYDVAYFEENELAVPDSLLDLTDPDYEGLLVVENPATSSPGLAFLFTTIAQFDTEGDYTYLDFWADLVANDVLIADGWETAYFANFTAGSEDGDRPLVVSYASSPPFTVDEETGIATTGSVVADGTCFRQIEFVGILAGTENLDAARQFVDFMLGVGFQEDVPFQMYVFPVNQQAVLPELFAEHAAVPENPVALDSAEIDANRETWIQQWTETVLR
jgi:thiamine transport system substrate-binding protein